MLREPSVLPSFLLRLDKLLLILRSRSKRPTSKAEKNLENNHIDFGPHGAVHVVLRIQPCKNL